LLASLHAEVLKLRHLRLWALATLSGAGVSVLACLTLRSAVVRFAGERVPEMPWQNAVVGDISVMLVLTLPTLVVLVTALGFHVEHRNDMWKQLRATPRSLASMYAAKFLVVQGIVALAVAIAVGAALVCWSLLPQEVHTVLPVDSAQVLRTLGSLAGQLYLSVIPVAILQFLLSTHLRNVLVPIGIGIALSTASLILAQPSTGRWFPYAYPRAVLMARFPPLVAGDQHTDAAFRAPRGAFGGAGAGGERILVDEQHGNRHGLGTPADPGTLRWIVPPAEEAHLVVEPLRTPMAPATLRGARLLVLAGASREVSKEETAALLAWLEEGGSLLLLTDHEPFAAPAQPLAHALGIGFTLRTLVDRSASDPRAPTSARLVFMRHGGIVPHPITEGVNRVVTYGGQGVWRDGRDTQRLLLLRDGSMAQLLAFSWGAGRVLVSGETALFTAQRKADGSRIGVSDPATDNARLAVQAFRWLLERAPTSRAPDSFRPGC